MKKIAFFVQCMLCGGVENALISLTKELVNKGNEVDIYMIKKEGAFVNKIPIEVSSFEIPMDSLVRDTIPVGGIKLAIKQNIQKKRYIKAAKMAIRHIVKPTDFSELCVDLSKIPKLETEYDIAVNFHLHSPFLVWYLSEKVKANIKYTWIHNDFSTTQYDVKKLGQYLDCVDKFFAVAENLSNEFCTIFPEYINKTQVALNIVSTCEVEKKGDLFYPKEYERTNKIKLLTVGRIEYQKGYDIAAEICYKLNNDGLDFDWYILGDGTERKKIERIIKKYKISNCFHLLGIKENPYPYFKNCDIYVQTSRHEGYVTTVTEAKIFNKPIVTTNVSGASEQLINGINGEITNWNSNEIECSIKKLIENEDIRKQYERELLKDKNIVKYDYINLF